MKVLSFLLALSVFPVASNAVEKKGVAVKCSAYYCTIIGGIRKCYCKI